MLKNKLSLICFSILLMVVLSSSVLAYQEAPMLKEKVESGKLEPVEERLPKEPLVIEPNHEIGQYGGTLTLGSVSVEPVIGVSPSQWSPALQSIQEYMLLLNRDLTEGTIPNIAKNWKFSEGGKVLTLYLREGMKWSDGHPFTADDILFWYKDVIQNKDITPVIPSWLKVEGKMAKIEKVDDYTVRYKFAAPY